MNTPHVILFQIPKKSDFYTGSLMTTHFFYVIVSLKKTGPQVRKGKAMLHTHLKSCKNTYRPYDLPTTFMPSAVQNEWFKAACLIQAGSSGYLGPGAFMRIME